MESKYQVLRDRIKHHGIKHPKKHGTWHSLNVFDDHFLVLDTWNGQIYHYPNGAVPSDTDNMYRCVYVFYDKEGKTERFKSVPENMMGFWIGHIQPITNGTTAQNN